MSPSPLRGVKQLLGKWPKLKMVKVYCCVI